MWSKNGRQYQRLDSAGFCDNQAGSARLPPKLSVDRKVISMEAPERKVSVWIVLGAFGLAFAIAWVGGAAWGVAATQAGRWLHFSATGISTLSLLGIGVIRLGVWIPVTRWVLKRRLGEIAFPSRPRGWLDLPVGAGLTALALAVLFFVTVRAGWLIIQGRAWQTLSTRDLLGNLWVSLLINAVVALVEEIIFRAYLLTGLRQAWGKPLALVVMAIIFGLIHAPALEGSQPLTEVAALLFMAAFGLLFGWVYLRTGSLWMPIGIHFAWDFLENDVFNLSGDMANPHVVGFATSLVGPSSTLGGLSNALLVDVLALALLCAGLWLWFAARSRVSPVTNVQEA